jgi:ComF family protein
MNGCTAVAQRCLPSYCALCGAPGPHRLCDGCEVALPLLPRPRCRICALPLPSGEVCGTCLSHPPRYDAITAVYPYAFPVDSLVHAYKYRGDLSLAPLLASALARAACSCVDVIVPMPLARSRLQERGFNQASEIARRVGAKLGIRVLHHASRKNADTAPQAALPWPERARNVRRAFVCDADMAGLRVAIVDDVMTTGATLEELARNLKRAGAITVEGWVVARTLR